MEKSKTAKNIDILSALTRVENGLRKAIIQKAGSDVIDAIGECAKQVDEGIVNVKPQELQRWKGVTKFLAKKGASRKKKRLVLLKVGKKLLEIIITPVVAYVLNHITK